MFCIHSSPLGELGTKDTGGMSVYVRELARELGRRGHRVDIFTRLRTRNDDPVVPLYENVRLVHLDIGTGELTKVALYGYLSDFERELEAFRAGENIKYDLIHSHYWLSGCLGNRCQQRWGRPHIILFHTLGAVKNHVGMGPPVPDVRITHEQRLVDNCHRILAPSEKEKRYLIQYYDASPEKIGVVPCGVNTDLFKPMDMAKARNSLGLNPGESIVLYVGRFEAMKGLDRLLKAMTLLRHHPGIRLVIVGGDGQQAPESKRLKRWVKRWDIEGTVTFAGRIEHALLPTYYSAADLLVVPSYYESFGMVGLEALACGTPVVSTPVGGMLSILKDSRIGYLTTGEVPEALAKGIESFVPGPEDPAVHRIRASALNYSWPHVASAILDQYETLLMPGSAGFREISNGK